MVSSKPTARDDTQIVLRAKGPGNFHPPLALPITVQLTNSDTDICWGATYNTADPNGFVTLRAQTP